MFWKSVLNHHYNYMKGYMEIGFIGPPFCFKKDKTTSYWHLNRLRKGVLYFTLTVIVCPATGPGDLKFITDSLPMFGLNQTFLIA